jgi:hypothetical protein
MSAEAATRALGGKWNGQHGVAMCPAHDNRRTPALSLADGEDGKLLVHCFAGCNGADVLRALNRRGLSDAHPSVAPPQNPNRPKSNQRDYALTLWREAQSVQNTLAERYLWERCIKPPLPNSLRFHPALMHRPSKTRRPAMIGLVTKGDGNKPAGIHRTYLAPNARKARVTPCKMMLGDCGGGAVRIADQGDGPVVICEGIETALSLRDALASETLAPRIWAALSTSGIAGLSLSVRMKAIVIAPDGDAPGHRAADKLAGRAKAIGIEVRIMAAPAGKDWNDVASGLACEASL